ncbi:MAG: hypothetical protein K9M54_08325 [Kiritimatiellales bacterium]|nr:hypothetical protein [Kiritimatiellales bacterium]
MNQSILISAAILAASTAWAESIVKPINDLGYGTISGRIQSLGMYRDFEGKGNGANETLGFILGYTSPQLAGFDGGLAYNYAEELYENNNTALLANDSIHVLNEGWIRYGFGSMNFSNTTVLVGRKINNGEVFRADDFRQKSRAIEAVQIDTADIPNTRLAAGHAVRLSNWIDKGDLWKFNDFGEVFGTGYDTDGITWGEGIFTGIPGLEAALFDAYAWDVANLAGTRMEYAVCGSTALLGYYRHESAAGKAATRNADAFGLSLRRAVGAIALEPGYFGVRGGDLYFQETTTGINHALDASMEICSSQFNEGSDTVYIKATTTIGKTALAGLYNYTWHDHTITGFDGQELDIIVKQPILENLTVAFKGGIGYRDWKNGSGNTTDTDARLFATYTF